MQSREWLQAGEVARRLRTTPQSVRNWARSGRLPSQRTNEGTYLFAAGDIEAFRGVGADGQPSWPGVLIKGRVWNQLDGWDGQELGGWLIGRDLGDRIVVEAIREEERAVRSVRSIALDLRRIPDLERAEAPGVGVVGDYHGHASWAGESASGRDWDAWATAATTLRQLWLGLVVQEPASPGQVQPNVSGYLTRPDGSAKWVSLVRI